MRCLILSKLRKRHLEVFTIENLGKTMQLEGVGSIKNQLPKAATFSRGKEKGLRYATGSFEPVIP